MQHIVILGGGYGGVCAALCLEKELRRRAVDLTITLVNREGYFIFQPMLAEVVGGTLNMLDVVIPFKRLLSKSLVHVREIAGVDFESQRVILSPKYSQKGLSLRYHHLVFALGTVTDFRNVAGLHEQAVPFKNLADAIHIRNQVIEMHEAAESETDSQIKEKLLTFVIVGGGGSGVAIAAEICDFSRSLVKSYKGIDPRIVRVILVHAKHRLMHSEVSPSIGKKVEDILKKKGVDVLLNSRLVSATQGLVTLNGGQQIAAQTIIATIPSAPNPLIEHSPLKLHQGRVITDEHMRVLDQPNVWAIGNCAEVPNLAGEHYGFQRVSFAEHQARILAHNIVACEQKMPMKSFHFKPLRNVGILGRRCAIMQVWGKYEWSGYLAWLCWRGFFWSKLPGIGRKIRVAISWFLDALLPFDPVHIRTIAPAGMAQLHFEKDDIIFNQGDVGDYLYLIIDGEVELSIEDQERLRVINHLGKGEFFGETALFEDQTRMATVRCVTPVSLFAVKKQDMHILLSYFQEFRYQIEQASTKKLAISQQTQESGG